jgi:hypothetical protein
VTTKTIAARHVEWKMPGNDDLNHAFAKDSINPFTALCGFHDGALSGGIRGRKCDVCCKKAEPYIKKTEAKRITAEKRWLASKTRERMLSRISKGIHNYNRGQLQDIIDQLDEWKKWEDD